MDQTIEGIKEKMRGVIEDVRRLEAVEIAACAAADDWVSWMHARGKSLPTANERTRFGRLAALELATRESPLRKVRP